VPIKGGYEIYVSSFFLPEPGALAENPTISLQLDPV